MPLAVTEVVRRGWRVGGPNLSLAVVHTESYGAVNHLQEQVVNFFRLH